MSLHKYLSHKFLSIILNYKPIITTALVIKLPVLYEYFTHGVHNIIK